MQLFWSIMQRLSHSEVVFFSFFFEIINSLFCYIYREFHSLSIGNPSIQNVYGATQILFNPDVEESAALRERLDIKSFNWVSIVLIIYVPEVLSHE